LYFDLTEKAVGGLVRRAGMSPSENNPIQRPRMPQGEPQWKRSKMAMERPRTHVLHLQHLAPISW